MAGQKAPSFVWIRLSNAPILLSLDDRVHLITDITVQLSVHPDTVRRVIGVAMLPPRGRLPVMIVIEPYSDFIKKTLERFPRLRATRIYDMIRERVFFGSARTVRRHLQEIRPQQRGEVCLRPQPLIGEQTQVDWMHIESVSVSPTQKRDLWAFVMVLSYSRAMWVELLFDLTAQGVRRSLIRGVQPALDLEIAVKMA